jgi:hypothetical protein
MTPDEMREKLFEIIMQKGFSYVEDVDMIMDLMQLAADEAWNEAIEWASEQTDSTLSWAKIQIGKKRITR